MRARAELRRRAAVPATRRSTFLAVAFPARPDADPAVSPRREGPGGPIAGRVPRRAAARVHGPRGGADAGAARARCRCTSTARGTRSTSRRRARRRRARRRARRGAAAGPGARAAARRSATCAPTSGSTSSAASAVPAALEQRGRLRARPRSRSRCIPVSVADLMAIADAGGIMPPKSTWFEPKLRDGLLITHLIRELQLSSPHESPGRRQVRAERHRRPRGRRMRGRLRARR